MEDKIHEDEEEEQEESSLRSVKIEEKFSYTQSISDNSDALRSSGKADKAKKESSGFSLFGFINSTKNKSRKVEEEAEEEVLESPIFKVLQADHPKVPTAKAEEAAKKHKEFFGSTVFDDEKEEGEEKIDDDILNVPAFFRRKK